MLSNRISRIFSLFDGGDEILFSHQHFLADIKKLDIRPCLCLFNFDDEGFGNPFYAFLTLVFSFILQIDDQLPCFQCLQQEIKKLFPCF